MRLYRVLLCAVAILCFAVSLLYTSSVRAQFPPLGDDSTTSLGQFRIVVAPAFRPAMVGNPFYDGISRLNSPLLFDPATTIGRSAPLLLGSPGDIGGVPVGAMGTMVSDGSFSAIPAGFQGPPGTDEVHTQITSFNLTAGPVAVRAGAAAPDRPISVGEVESNSGASGNPALDFPARSFFDVFVDVDLPGLGTLHNTTPLIVENSTLTAFPPKVVYIHGNTSPVPLVFNTANPGFWNAGDVFGTLVLAGHGVGFNINNPTDVAKFQTIIQSLPEIPEPASVILLGTGIVALAVYAWKARKRLPHLAAG